MKKTIITGLVLITLFAMASCGSSRKYGCPATAKHSSTISVKA